MERRTRDGIRIGGAIDYGRGVGWTSAVQLTMTLIDAGTREGAVIRGDIRRLRDQEREPLMLRDEVSIERAKQFGKAVITEFLRLSDGQ